ncbi:hypothetical protein FNV43_RR24425 [Rhamnella rubrinervis]|uniref:Cation/H+ exchanger domain-containing protein n=1 Tax=Rhamnella rubrinervis TaxID=2594499 RepID=A0A8K0DSE1_9ROSA|nr:hypothetical protein FNV43_RR24425 [Rhamnella rubrinervis]
MASERANEMVMVIGNRTLVCHNFHPTTTKGFWDFGHAFNSPTPLLLLQFSAICMVSKLLEFCLKPLGQSSIVSHIFGGLVFGPSFLGHKRGLGAKLFPLRGMVVLETISTFGLMFFFFAIGVKMDPETMFQLERKAMGIGFSVFIFTLTLPSLLSLVLIKYLPMDPNLADSLPIIAASQSITSFPVIACLLNELNILNTDLGRLALSSSTFCDVLGMTLTVAVLAFVGDQTHTIILPVLGIISTILLVVAIMFVFRPAILWMRNRSKGGKYVKETYVFASFTLVLVVAFLCEGIGQHYVLGPLILGLVVPNGPPFGAALASKVDTLATVLFYPTYLAVSGLQTNFYKVQVSGLVAVGIITLFACITKVGAVMVTGHYTNIPRFEAFVLGLIMNGKGIIELMVLNLWRQNKILKDQEFALGVISVLVVTAIITPFLRILHNPSKQYFVGIKRSSIQHTKRDSPELRILVCIHNHESVSTIMNLLEVSHASTKNPLAVIALVLVELVGRTSPIFIAHDQRDDQNHSPQTTTSTSVQILNALKQYQRRCDGSTTLQSFTSVSHFKWMHDDICRVAKEKRTHIVILPFHKQWAIDGSVGLANASIRNMNLNVIQRAPCSVGILVDRGILAGTGTVLASKYIYNVAVIFIGGSDDAESLAYGARMAKHETVDLTVVRFLQFGDVNSKDRKRDSELIHEYRQANAGNERFVIVEELVKDGEGLFSGIGAMVDCFDLILVGRDHPESPLLLGMDKWCECPELGVVGDMLASSDSATAASVLVVQQQRVIGNNGVVVNKGKEAGLVHDAPFYGGKPSWTITVEKHDK